MSSPSSTNAIADHRVVAPPPERRHVVCVVDGSPDSFSGLATAHRVRAEGRLTVVLVDRWAAFALACPEYAVDPAFLREGGEAWVRERLAEEGIGGAQVVVLDHPGALGAWIERARPDLVVVVERRGLPRLIWGSSSRSLARLGASLLVLDPPRRRAERGRAARVPDRAHRETALLTTTPTRWRAARLGALVDAAGSIGWNVGERTGAGCANGRGDGAPAPGSDRALRPGARRA